MKQLFFNGFFLLLSYLSFAQSKANALNAILINTSAKKSYAILFKNSSNNISFVWSDQLLECYTDKGCSRSKAIQIIKTKLLKNDTFEIIKSSNILVSAIDSNKYRLVNKSPDVNLSSFMKKFFKNNQLNSIHSNLVKEISFFLWQRNAYLFIGLDNGSLPSVAILNNKPVSITKPKKTLSANIINNNDVYFYFSDYNFYLNVENKHTTLLYLKLDTKRTDVQKLSENIYTGEFDYAKFTVDERKKNIIVDLFNASKEFMQTRKYKYDNKIQIKEEQYFYSLTSHVKKIRKRVIVPIMYN